MGDELAKLADEFEDENSKSIEGRILNNFQLQFSLFEKLERIVKQPLQNCEVKIPEYTFGTHFRKAWKQVIELY